jgi:hypothetical protein
VIGKATPAKIKKWEKARKVKKLIRIEQSNDEHLCKLAKDAIKNVLTSCRKDLYKQGDNKTKIKAVEALGTIKSLSSAADLRYALNVSSGKLRTLIIWALGELRDHKADRLIEKELFMSKWGIYPNLTRCAKAEQALKKIDTHVSRAGLSCYKKWCKEEKEAKQRPRCPICKMYISPLAIGCHRCKKIFEKRDWITTWDKR